MSAQSVRTAPADTAPPAAPRPGANARRRRGSGARAEERAAYVLLSPWILGAALITLIPMAVSLYLSFTSYDIFSPPQWVGLRNYVEMFTADPRYWSSVGTTVAYAAIAVPAKLAVALLAALALNELRRGSGFYRSAFYAPSLLGGSLSIALVWRSLFDDDGTVDRLLSAVGITTGSWSGQPGYALVVVALLSVWQFGAPMVIFLAGLQQIPRDLYEAAELDGAGAWHRFASITVPMLSPVIFFNLVLEVIHSFQAFTSAFVVSGGRGGPADSTLLYTLYLYQKGFVQSAMGYASAMAWVLLLAIGVITVLLFRFSRGWVHYANEER